MPESWCKSIDLIYTGKVCLLGYTSFVIMQRTPLYDLHCAARAHFIDCAGFEMPLHYAKGAVEEHLHTRRAASLFDLSHQAQIEISGPGAERELERLMPLDLNLLGLSQQARTVLPNRQGGVMDELVVSRRNRDNFHLVVNAACKQKVIAHLSRELQDSSLNVLEDQCLLALQGPAAVDSLLRLFSVETGKLRWMEGMLAKFQQAECFISRSGLTGEDGFELSIASKQAIALAKQLLKHDGVRWAGQGAADTLRLEAGFCRYGQELTEDISPVSAGLARYISKSRQSEGDKAGAFLGAEIILHQLETGTADKRIGLVVQDKLLVPEGTVLRDLRGNEVGVVTSAAYSPSLQVPVAMAYVEARCSQSGTELLADADGKELVLNVCRLPFVAHHHAGGQAGGYFLSGIN